jgi:HEPN domain-containing protein
MGRIPPKSTIVNDNISNVIGRSTVQSCSFPRIKEILNFGTVSFIINNAGYRRSKRKNVMVDISEQIAYWRDGAKEDWEAACQLIDNNKTRHGMFFAHLALEKILKAHVCKKTGKLAPRLHNLVRLAETAELELSCQVLDTLAEMNEFNLEGRYPITFVSPPTKKESQAYMKKAKEVFEWLTQKL